MPKRLLITGIITLGYFILGFITVPTAEAAGTVSVLGSTVDLSNLEQVSVAQSGITISYTVNSNSANTICWPIQGSINSDTVYLTSQSDSRLHPIYTLAWSKKSESYSADTSTVFYYKFSLSVPHLGYELLPNTRYILKLVGGSNGVRFACQNGSGSTIIEKYLPSAGYNVEFDTDGDLVAPIITESSMLNTDSSAVFGWITSEPARTQISYGTTSSYGITKSVPGIHEKHFIELANLHPGTTYYYKLEAKDADGPGVGEKTGTFTTWDIGAISLYDITGHEASLRWTTNPTTDSMIEYGTSQNLGQISGKHGLATNHDVRLVHLQSNQTYYVRIKLSNGEAESVSEIFSFKTLDASAGVSREAITVDPQFSSQFILSNFNFKDFPEDETPLTSQASDGAVLADTDKGLYSIAGDFGSIVDQYRWAIWLWIPVLLLLFLIACIWLLHRHQHKTSQMHQEIAKHKVAPSKDVLPPQINP